MFQNLLKPEQLVNALAVNQQVQQQKSASRLAPPPFQLQGNALQRKSTDDDKEEEALQLKTKGKGGVEQQMPVQRSVGSGQQMNPNVQSHMEGAFNTDFSNVNIHTNSSAADQVNALAFTQGNDIHFASGQYNPNNSAGMSLLGHELTHVVQQRKGEVKANTQIGGYAVNNEQHLEGEADRMGEKVAQGKFATPFSLSKHAGISGSTGTAPVQRKGVIQREGNGDEREETNTNPQTTNATPQTESQGSTQTETPTTTPQSETQPQTQTQTQGQGTTTTQTPSTTTQTPTQTPSTTTQTPSTGTQQPTTSSSTASNGNASRGQHSVLWMIDYNQTISGRGRSRTPNTRKANSVLLIDSFNMRPSPYSNAQGIQVPPTVSFRGMNPLTSGSIAVGPQNHPAGLDGEVSGTIRYGTRRNMRLQYDFSNEVPSSQRSSVQRHLSSQLDGLLDTARSVGEVERQLQQEGNGRLTRGSLNAVRLQSTGTSRLTRYSLPAIRYNTIDSNKMIDAMIDIRSERTEEQFEYQQNSESRAQAGSTTGTTSNSSIQIQNSTQVTNEITSQLNTAVTTAVNAAVRRHNSSTSTTETEFTGRGALSLGGQINLGGSASGTADLGSLLSLLGVAGRLGRLLNIGEGLQLELGYNASGQANGQGELEATIRRTSTDSTTSGTDITLTAEQRREISQMVRSHIQTKVTTQVTSQSSSGSTSGGSTQVSGRRGSSSRVSGTNIRYRNPIPLIRIRGMR